MLKKKVIARNTLLMEMKSRPREHAHEEGLKSISSDASSICHKTSSKLFLVIGISHLVDCFKICFNYVLPVPMESSINRLIKYSVHMCLSGKIAWNYGVT